ncbi:hypothetical protein [Escherichia coli]|uniref:hypothetical protein n=1 Tax=Escherichia coli TaxID=562 RepID=UPI00201AD6F5|nr:hypothetical protein [Escherichia coli]
MAIEDGGSTKHILSRLWRLVFVYYAPHGFHCHYTMWLCGNWRRSSLADIMFPVRYSEEKQMAARNFYTKEQIEQAKKQLEALPDLTETRLTGKDVLEGLKSQIMELATRKGYSVKDIKSALESCQITVSERAIKEIITTHQNTRRKSSRNQKKSSSSSDMQTCS